MEGREWGDSLSSVSDTDTHSDTRGGEDRKGGTGEGEDRKEGKGLRGGKEKKTRGKIMENRDKEGIDTIR